MLCGADTMFEAAVYSKSQFQVAAGLIAYLSVSWEDDIVGEAVRKATGRQNILLSSAAVANVHSLLPVEALV